MSTVQPGVPASGRARLNKIWGRTPDVSAALTYRERMLPVWIQQLDPTETIDVSGLAPSLLKGLYPNVYYWGVRGDDLARNLTRIINVLTEQREGYAVAAAEFRTDRSWIAFDLIETYLTMKLTRILTIGDMRSLFDYVALLQERELFEVAYRNVDVAEMNGENILVSEDDTLLHRYYQHESWDTAAYADTALEKLQLPSNTLRVILSMLPRLVLSEPVIHQLPQFNDDWDAHAAFCERWGLIP